MQRTSSGLIRPADELVDEIEQTVVRPVDVLEHEDERLLLSESLDEALPGCEALAALAADWPVAVPDERLEVAHEPACLIRVVSGPVGRAAHLPPRLGRRVALEDAALGLDDLAERPEADAVAVGQGAPWRQLTGPPSA